MTVADIAVLVLEAVLIGQVTWLIRKTLQLEKRLSTLEAKSKFYNQVVDEYLKRGLRE